MEEGESLPAGLPAIEAAEVPDLVERYRRTALRLLKEGQAARAFGELVRASHTLPMTTRLAAALVAVSRQAGTEAAALALLASALGNTQGDTRRAVRLQLVRLLRRVGQLPRARETLQALVDEVPGDRLARRLLNALTLRLARREGRPSAPPGARPPAAEQEAPREVPPAVGPVAAPQPEEDSELPGPLGRNEPLRRRAREEPVPTLSAVSEAETQPVSTPAEGRPEAFQRLQENPLESRSYRQLSVLFADQGELARSALMAELATALSGGKPSAPRPPSRPLTPEERAQLRHPGLGHPAGELLACVGAALCRLFPTFGRAAGSTEPLCTESGPGAAAVLEALQSAARLLGVEVPEALVSLEDGPPFVPVHPGAPRLLVGRLALEQPLPEEELRFFAGRALASLEPELLALRCLKEEQLRRAV
ncbi:MAG TPA: hypothetical protein VMK65_10905, partial [Longimicrobiales bacterium]|nr:hypothetical protein [Longimicrobiales bacterium]